VQHVAPRDATEVLQPREVEALKRGPINEARVSGSVTYVTRAVNIAKWSFESVTNDVRDRNNA
jgi:hypothetical protein